MYLLTAFKEVIAGAQTFVKLYFLQYSYLNVLDYTLQIYTKAIKTLLTIFLNWDFFYIPIIPVIDLLLYY